jgi:hypothetical protein
VKKLEEKILERMLEGDDIDGRGEGRGCHAGAEPSRAPRRKNVRSPPSCPR